MHKLILIIFLNMSLYGYNSSYEKEHCNYIKNLPVEATAFYNKFQDTKATLALFENIYPMTKDKCLSSKEHEALLKIYSLLMKKSNNIQMLKQLLEKYPNKLFLIKDLADSYKKAYQSKEKKFNRNKYKNRALALQTYDIYIQKGGVVDKETKVFIENKGLKRVKNPWRNKFKIDTVPINNYNVIYFNNKNPKKIIHEDIVPYPAVNYSHNNFPKFKFSSEDFAAYWVGDISFSEDTDKVLSFEVSWAEFRLIIDGFEVAKSVNDDAHVPYHFTKGIHRIEIEYTNNYGATDFMMSMHDKRTPIDNNQIKTLLPEDFELFYVGKYESENFDKSLSLKIKNQYKKPIVLILNSYGNIQWNIDANHNKIQSIFVHSYHHGSIVNTARIPKNKIHFMQRFQGNRSLRIKCKCTNYNLYCEGTKLSSFNEDIKRQFNKYLNGFTTFYPKDRFKDKTLLIPEVYLDAKMLAQIEKEEKNSDTIKDTCRKKNILSIDNIFE